MHIIGYIGLCVLTLSWLPQTFQTIREKECKVNFQFLILNFAGSFSLMVYAMLLGDAVFSILNFMTSLGAAINVFYKLKAEKEIA